MTTSGISHRHDRSRLHVATGRRISSRPSERFLWVAVAAVTLVVAFPAWAQSAATGATKGGVKNAARGKDLKKDAREPYVIAPIDAPFAMPQLQPPVFPNRVFDLREFGAVGDGVTLNTAAFAKAIAACHAAGGGRVLVPTGVWLTGSIHLRSHVELHISENAKVLFSNRFEDYLPAVFTRKTVECYSLSPLIYAVDCTDIAVTGAGEMEGQGDDWGYWEEREGASELELEEQARRGVPVEQRRYDTPTRFFRPSFIETVNCRNVFLQGVSVVNGPTWMINPVYCENVMICAVRVIGTTPPDRRYGLHFHVHNGGINPNSSRNVLIEHCHISTGDDGIVLKSGKDDDGWRVGRACENVVVRDCVFKVGARYGALAIGSEMSGDVRNVLVRNCRFEGTALCFRIKSMRGRGGIVENVWVQDIDAGTLRTGPVIWLETSYGIGKPWYREPQSDRSPLFRNIHIRNVTCQQSPQSLVISGLPERYIENVTFENIRIAASQTGIQCDHARGVSFRNVSVTPAAGPVLHLTDCQRVATSGVACPPGTDLYLRVSGAKSQHIELAGTVADGARNPVLLDRDVVPDAVMRR